MGCKKALVDFGFQWLWLLFLKEFNLKWHHWSVTTCHPGSPMVPPQLCPWPHDTRPNKSKLLPLPHQSKVDLLWPWSSASVPVSLSNTASSPGNLIRDGQLMSPTQTLRSQPISQSDGSAVKRDLCSVSQSQTSSMLCTGRVTRLVYQRRSLWNKGGKYTNHNEEPGAAAKTAFITENIFFCTPKTCTNVKLIQNSSFFQPWNVYHFTFETMALLSQSRGAAAALFMWHHYIVLKSTW